MRQIIGDVLQTPPMPFLKQTMDEVEIQGSESKYDTRKLNSYPSKVTLLMSLPVHTGRVLCLYPCLGDAEDECRGIVCEEKTINIPKFPPCVSWLMFGYAPAQTNIDTIAENFKFQPEQTMSHDRVHVVYPQKPNPETSMRQSALKIRSKITNYPWKLCGNAP